MNASRVTHGDVGLYSGVIAPRFVLVSVHGWSLTLPIQGCFPRIHLGVGPVCLDGPSVYKWRHKRPRMLESDAKKQKYWRNQWVRQHLWREVDRQCFGSGPLCLFPCIGPAYPAEFLQNFGLFAGLRVSTFSPGHPMGLCHTPSVDGTLDISSIRRKPSPSTPTRILHPTLSKSPETNPG